MTREKLINGITKDVATEFKFSDLTEIIDSGATEFIINKVCDDFESRTCNNCKYIKDDVYNYKEHTQKYKACILTVASSRDFKHTVTEDFGCNRWEPKDE